MINKIDRRDARPQAGPERGLRPLHRPRRHGGAARVPVVYTNAKARHGPDEPDGPEQDLRPLFEAADAHMPPPRRRSADGPLQLLIANLDYSDYLGRLGIGRIFSGTVKRGRPGR